MDETNTSGFLRSPLVKVVKPIKFDFDDKIRLITTKYFSNLIVTDKNELFTWGQSPQSLRLATQAKKRAKASQKVVVAVPESTTIKSDNNKESSEATMTTDPIEVTTAQDVDVGEEATSETTSTTSTENTKEEADESNDHYFPVQVDTSEVEGEMNQVRINVLLVVVVY